MPRLSLDCLTLTDTAPAEMIRAAGAAGFDLVSLWFNDQAIYPRALVTAENLGECEAAMAETGVRLYTLEAFELTSSEEIATCGRRSNVARGSAARWRCAIIMAQSRRTRPPDCSPSPPAWRANRPRHLHRADRHGRHRDARPGGRR